MKQYKIILLALSLFAGINAQTASDAITFGQHHHGGTSRYMGMSGAFNALGGDFSTLSVNPAGLGVYRSSEAIISCDLLFNKTTTDVNEANTNGLTQKPTSISDRSTDFKLTNFGYVGTQRRGNSGLVSQSFAIGFNHLKSLNKSYRAEVFGSAHSLTDSWAQPLNSATTGAYVADQAYLMNRVGDDENIQLLSPLIEGARTDYIKDVVEKGHIREWVFSYGANINNIVYFGATFGLQSILQEKEYFQTEYFLNTTHIDPFYDERSYIRFSDNGATENVYQATDADNFTYYSSEKTSGVGFNGKFGVLVRPTDALRIGFAVHTPTINYLSVSHYGDLTNRTIYINDKNEETVFPAEGSEYLASYNYRTVSPYKLHLGIGLVVGKRLALDVEADMVDYSTMKIKDDRGKTFAYTATNKAIEQMYKTAFNGRIGAEFKVLPALALRAGAAYYDTPYKDNFYTSVGGEVFDAADYVGGRFEHSIGLGYRTGDFFMDFAYVRAVQNNKAFVFDDAIDLYELDEFDLNHKYNRFMLTLGLKF